MKTLFLVLLLPFTASAAHDHPAVHGMLLFGKSKIYLSHLPMFHSPHNYQVILEAELDRPSLAAYEASLEGSPETVYTISPEHFVLPEMAQRPRPFSAVLYRGHFERGGTAIAEATVKITKVIHFSPLRKNGPRLPQSQFLHFGHPGEAYVAHLISAAPDFDQIALVDLPAGATTGSLTLPSLAWGEPLQEGEMHKTEDGRKLKVEQSLYLEFGDLAH